MNLRLLKQISILSVILGAILGLVTLIPYIGVLSFLICVFAAGSLVLIYLQKLELIGELDTRAWSIYGAISGFVAFIGFSISFVPLATIIGFIYKGSFYLGVSLLFRSGIFVTIMMVLFVAILAALMNAFSGLVTMYIYNQIETKPEEAKTNIEIQE